MVTSTYNGSQILSTERRKYSSERVEVLRTKLKQISELKNFPNLTIFCAGSYGRFEASKYSDIDMFFFDTTENVIICEDAISTVNTTEKTKLFGKIVDVADELNYPKFTNDGEYLNIIYLDKVLNQLGGRHDDYDNTFTARMLLLLESKYLVNEELYNSTISKCIKSYFRDYPKHSDNFKPIFLINDITRYWKTLCLNYENKRNQRHDYENKKIPQKVKNFKLKFSRMTTCFATIASLACQIESITEENVIELVGLTPSERLLRIADFIPRAKSKIDEIVLQYEWFLMQTGLSEEELHSNFDNKEHRIKMFKKASIYGDKMFELLKIADEEYNFFRYLVI